MQKYYPGLLEKAYEYQDLEDPYDVLRAAAACRRILKENNEADLDRTASAMIHEFRRGKLGRITLEHEEDVEDLSE